MLRICNVTKKYGDFTALENINLTLENGIYALLAPNGAGKTTLMKMMATLSFPTSGKITWNGKDILRMGEKYRDKIGYLPQNFGYYKDYTPKQFLDYLCVLKGIKKDMRKKRVEEVLDLVALREAANKKMKKFSGGMIQRIGIAQALLNHPDLLILDEPTAGLDPKERVRFQKILSSISQNKIVLISTHIVSDVEFVANSVIMLKNHSVLCQSDASGICKALEGKVYEMRLENVQLKSFEEQYQVVARRQEGDRVVVRFISDYPAQTGWIPSDASMEDVFLYTYRE